MKKWIWFFAVILIGCASMTFEQEQWMDLVQKQPLSFTITKNKDKDAWARARAFITRYSSTEKQSSTEFNIETFKPTKGGHSSIFHYGYMVSKIPYGDNFDYDVSCKSDNIFDNNASNNEHILAWYIITGEIKYPELIKK